MSILLMEYPKSDQAGLPNIATVRGVCPSDT
jgi:hypothetical protein